MTHLPEDAKDAVQRLANGETVGMVESALKKKGIGSGPSSEILDRARRLINRRARLRNMLIGVVGVLILATGAYWFYLCANNQNHRIQLPVLGMGCGLLLAVYGIYSATRNEV